MPEVPTAPGAQDLRAGHPQRAILPFNDRPIGSGPVEARPTGTRLELGLRVEQFGAAAGAMEHSFAVDVQQLS